MITADYFGVIVADDEVAFWEKAVKPSGQYLHAVYRSGAEVTLPDPDGTLHAAIMGHWK